MPRTTPQGEGSPPPTRGTRAEFVINDTKGGITPAYAGNTASLGHLIFSLQDHPRLRGEHIARSLTYWELTGSPPPTRGTRYLYRCLFYKSRITPAYAGNTCRSGQANTVKKDHPRLRGEHPLYCNSINRLSGSPPPTRGTQYNIVNDCFLTGITPAYAGNTLQLLGSLRIL